MSTETELQEVINRIFEDRKSRKIHPSGNFDGAKRWYPDVFERCKCCEGLALPTRSYPYSLMHHCRTKKHITQLVLKQFASDILHSVKEVTPENIDRLTHLVLKDMQGRISIEDLSGL